MPNSIGPAAPATTRQCSATLRSEGWCVLTLADRDPVDKAATLLEGQLRSELNDSRATLADYHRHFKGSEEDHIRIQHKMTVFLRSQKLAREIISANLDSFQSIVAIDLDIQREPYLRITRPDCPQDNIGYHRDTFYGGSPYEVSVLIPFVDVASEGSLLVLPGSHTAAESEFPTEKTVSADVQKGSVKHSLGFLYAPKIIAPDFPALSAMHPVPLKKGQVLMFSLSTLHGSVVNKSTATRWSTDVRLKNALAPVDLSSRSTYYEPLCLSAVTEQAVLYLQANR